MGYYEAAPTASHFVSSINSHWLTILNCSIVTT